MKRCSKCAEEKPLEDYYKNLASPDGRRGDCKVCVLVARRERYEDDPETLKARVAKYRADNPERVAASVAKYRTDNPEAYRARNRTAQLRRYGLTQESYDETFSSQGQRCAICRSDDPGQHWSIDHDHVTGAVRGILCWHCNVALGHFRDDPVALVAAADYLVRSRSEVVASAGA